MEEELPFQTVRRGVYRIAKYMKTSYTLHKQYKLIKEAQQIFYIL